jgi:hypothetical protein
MAAEVADQGLEINLAIKKEEEKTLYLSFLF